MDEKGRTIPLAALEQLRLRIRTRHYSYRTECCYVDWARRFFDYLVDQQGGPQPQVHAEAVRDYLTHLAVHKRVSASTQNQAMCAAADRARQRRIPGRSGRGRLRAGDGGCVRVGRRAGDAGEGPPQGLLRPGLLPRAARDSEPSWGSALVGPKPRPAEAGRHECVAIRNRGLLFRTPCGCRGGR